MNVQEVTAKTHRLLVVDDQESNRYVLASWLRRAGYDVVEAATGEEALRSIEARIPDLVVLDINLPDMTGYVVCERIKAGSTTKTTPVLHVSATAIGSSDRSEGLRRGADGFLVEPVEKEELLATVEALLRGARAERTAIRLARQLRQLNVGTLAINSAQTIESLVATIAQEASLLFGAPAIFVVAVDDRGYSAATEDGISVSAVSRSTLDVHRIRSIAGDAIEIPAAAFEKLLPCTMFERYFAATLDDQGHRGVLLIGQPASFAPDSEELEILLTQYARAAGTAIRNMRTYDIERRIAITLQRNLLPDAVPSIPQLEVAVRYEASSEQAEVGGDFYEIFILDDENVALAIGDVVGHSLEAATVMAHLRNGIRCYALEGHGPLQTVTRLNRLLRQFHSDVTATVCCAVYNRRTGHCEIANAGHPPPLVLTAEGPHYLPIGGPLLGVEAEAAKPCEFTLKSGDILLLYTDGLIERRNEAIDAGLDRLAAAANHPVKNLEAFCNRVLEEAGPKDLRDDVAIVAIRPTL